MVRPVVSVLLLLLCVNLPLLADDGYKLWLRYDLIENQEKISQYKQTIQHLYYPGGSATILAGNEELMRGMQGLLGLKTPIVQAIQEATLIVGTPAILPQLKNWLPDTNFEPLGKEGFLIQSVKIDNKKCLIIGANTDVGALYGIFQLLKLLQTQQDISQLAITQIPKTQLRLLNHWDNLDGSVERGYAGASLWQWHQLPEYTSQRYKDYARANASVGINGTVLTNVNANALVLTSEYLKKVAALADVFRPYGIQVYLTARFSAPIEIGNLDTADPLDDSVKTWWKNKADEIYNLIPDLGGFLVKANSEGQPGPQNYGRSHADGANLLADAVAPHQGVVMWRAFVYDNNVPDDRAKQAFNEFKPLDGKFRDNVLIQVKNGAIDFQPREPFHPLFGAMPNTPLMMEFQVTQEYFGQGLHLTYLAPLYQECLQADTYAHGKGSYVSKIIDGTLEGYSLTGMAGVSNIGSDRNWTGHPFGQANWYALGRLAWDPELTAEAIADDWIRMTFSNQQAVIEPIKKIMIKSREAGVNYRTPLGLHHLMAWHHHYGPGPWIDKGRADWTPIYYHRADSSGIGFDRTKTGSNALAQYYPEVQKMYADPTTCPEEVLLWFHHLPWNYQMKSGKSLWNDLCDKYYQGVAMVHDMQTTWNSLEGKIDTERFEQVQALLKIQYRDAVEWRNACVLYFQTYSQKPIPEGLEKPDQSLEYYKKIDRKYLPGS